MRLIRLFAFAAPLALLLPLSANAAWPAGVKDKYMNDCTSAASKSVNPAEANKHCACGADVLEKKFTTQEISQLMDPKTPPTAELGQRALKEISVCRVQK
ncbi:MULTISPECIES: hypothetical protein [Pseudomonas]|uniref:Uncharacterized protein n=1 Tax=Pseudomonas koreensis TaxID=198620 RepID=A0AA94END7_9PSED|nr:MULTISPECIES: hypothetical protein [Pseudomonas]MBT9268519.1 hypothetical protein [Pseudomonas sp. MG-9]RVD76804.1 hypothetical protein A9HBioS_3344 [Pseudomonas koreensis]